MIKDKRFISGALFANIYLLEAVCRLGGSTLFNNIYHKTRPLFGDFMFIKNDVLENCIKNANTFLE
jgi:hypothetical protein